MNFDFVTTAVREHCGSLAAKPTNVAPRCELLPEIQAVLFDIYGTLLISASGDIGTGDGDHKLRAIESALAEANLEVPEPSQVLHRFEESIRKSHADSREKGIAFPEVDIVDVWAESLGEFHVVAKEAVQRLSFDYEVRVNPVWPMPGISETLRVLAESEMVLGIVSNAQFFTPSLFPALLDKSLEQLGFSSDLMYFSFAYGQAKPGTFLYEQARAKLAEQSIPPESVLFVGNDMRNDILAASRVGFRTALFAGDQRSLRLREDDQDVAGCHPDLVVTELAQLLKCLPT